MGKYEVRIEKCVIEVFQVTSESSEDACEIALRYMDTHYPEIEYMGQEEPFEGEGGLVVSVDPLVEVNDAEESI